MKRVTILAMFNTMASTVTGPMDVFYQAGVIWNYFQGQEVTPFFKTEIVTTDGEPFRCLNGTRMLPDGSIRNVASTDLIIVSSILNIAKTMKYQGEVVDWLKHHYRRGTHIATICTGAFVLAETGLLDGKTATTHWGAADEFRRRYPQIHLKPERLITDEGDLFCSGGMNAGTDLSLYLVEKYCGHEVALQSSKALISDIGRSLQAPYAIFQFQKDHNDRRILAVQKLIEENFDQDYPYEELASRFGMSRRTFERRFKAATGDTPLVYLQRVRVEAAKRLLESQKLSFDEITYRVGYEDSSTFRKIFLKQTGLRPKEYQRRFQRM
ncbi:MAG: GlxA family transcriptional regulator [Deltaproteobacteria bacterium]|nr:MAG: GlxA family transcriptional regulator [Deltaproteobacteria bacterium]